MSFLIRNKRKLYYRIDPAVHQQHSDTVVFIHTNITDHSLYDRIFPFFQDEFNVIRYDLAGFGLSESDDQPSSLESHVEDLIYLAQTLNLSPFYIVAIGFGGLIALEYSRLFHGMVKKMVLMTMPCFPVESLHSVRSHRKKISFNGTQIPAEQILKKATLLQEHDPEFTRLRHIILQQPVSTYMEIMDLTISANTIAFLKNNKSPALILAGEHEIVFPQYLLALECAHLPGYQYSVIPNSSSFLMIDQPEITAKLAKEFFKTANFRGRFKDDTSLSISQDIHLYAQNSYLKNMTSKQEANQIQINLLYSFEITINKHRVIDGLSQRYAKNILAYLLFHPTTTREEICEHLWPQYSLKKSKENLRVYLYYLKKLLNAHSLQHQPILIVDRESIRLNGHLHSDLLDLLALLHEIEFTENIRKYVLANKIMGQFHSANFMTSLYDTWFLDIRNKVESKLINLAIWVGNWHAQNGKEEEGLDFIKQSLPIFNDHIKLYDALVKLSQQISDETQLQYWINERSKI